MQQETQMISLATGEKCEVIRSYVITREVDSMTKEMENELELLMKKYDFDFGIENFPIATL